jgi:hypothetical protein
MKFSLRALAAGASLTALVVVAVTAYPALAREMEADARSDTDLRTELTATDRRAAELARQEHVVVRRTAMRAETVEDLIAGRIPVDEAVRRFVFLNHMEPGTLRRVNERYPGATDEERAGRQLVAHVRVHPDPRAAAAADDAARRLGHGPAN